MFVASSKVSPDLLGGPPMLKKKSDLLQRCVMSLQVMSFNPLVDQFAMEVRTAAGLGAWLVFQRSVTTGCRVACHFNPCGGTGNFFVPTFSPKVKSA